MQYYYTNQMTLICSNYLQLVKNQPKTYSGKIMKHILRHAATKFAKLKPGEETAQEALYKDELQEIFEDFHYNQVGEENLQIYLDPLACY